MLRIFGKSILFAVESSAYPEFYGKVNSSSYLVVKIYFMKQFFVLLLMGIFVGSCSVDSSNQDLLCEDSGEVIDYDETECACCPGWIIVVNNTDTIKVFDIVIEEELWEIVNTSGYPVGINLEASRQSGDCLDFYHDVYCIEIQ